MKQKNCDYKELSAMIQWYPGHMKKARDEITEAIKKMDVVIELVDARLPKSSSNPVLSDLRGERPVIRILTKKDLADPLITERWISEMEKNPSVKAIDVETHDTALVRVIPALARKLAGKSLKRSVRAIIVGIPNVGKSTLMNTLAGRRLAKVGNQPAITRHQQTVSIIPGPDGMDISDTPGILWPNLASQKSAFRLALSGAIRDTAMDYRDVALFAGDFFMNRYPDALQQRYKFKQLPETSLSLLEQIGRKRGCLVKGGGVDTHKASEIFVHDFRAGKLGCISLECPGDEEPESIDIV